MTYKLTKYAYGKLKSYTAYMLTPSKPSAKNPVQHFVTPEAAQEFLRSKSIDPAGFDWRPLHAKARVSNDQ